MSALIIVVAALAANLQESAKPVRAEKQAKPPVVTHPLSKHERDRLNEQFKTTIEATSKVLEDAPMNARAISSRADALFFSGKFREAVRDYDRMVELDPSIDKSHWRRGIAYFYAGEFDKAAKQFERYHVYDNVDRENGIWRYLSQHKAHGRDRAREGLLKYQKDDREPFPAVYKLFAGKTTPDEILREIRSAKVSETEREKRVFYAELYIGLNELVEGRRDSAARHLRAATVTKWPRTAGFGPNYMWHVGRVQLDLLMKRPSAENSR